MVEQEHNLSEVRTLDRIRDIAPPEAPVLFGMSLKLEEIAQNVGLADMYAVTANYYDATNVGIVDTTDSEGKPALAMAYEIEPTLANMDAI